MSRIFRHSRWDVVSMATVPVALGLQFCLAYHFERLGVVGLVAGFVALYFADKAVVRTRHNFFHTPFFVSARLNRAGRLWFAAHSTVPPSAYSIGHNLHHKHTIAFNAFRLRDALGLTSVRGVVGSFAPVLDPFGLRNVALLVHLVRRPRDAGPPAAFPTRFDSHQHYNGVLFGEVLARLSRDRRLLRQVALESALGVSLRIALVVVDYRFFVCCYLPYLYLDGFVAIVEDFADHYGVDGDDVRRNSASCYARWFNLLGFNVGYHQEHHLRPGLHWTRLPAYRREMLPEAQRRIARFSQTWNAFFPIRSRVTRSSVP